MEVRWKVLLAAVGVGMTASAALLLRAPSPAATVTGAVGSTVESSKPSAASVAAADQKLPGSWVDLGPQGTAALDKAPLVIALHGRGDTPEQFSALAARLGPAWAWRFLKAPLPWRENTQWFNGDAADAGKADLAAASALVRAHVRSAAGRKVVLLGFSQGCMVVAHHLAHASAAERREVWAAVCAAGRLPNPPASPTADAAAMGSTPQPPVLFVHGQADAVVPVERAREAVRLLGQLGVAAVLREHAEGHTLPEPVLDGVRTWLQAQLQ